MASHSAAATPAVGTPVQPAERPRALAVRCGDLDQRVSVTSSARRAAAFRRCSKPTSQIYDREFLTIVGPSGCGKSTLMNMIVGLFPPSSGEVLYRGKRHAGVNRSIGYVTQADNLYPWRTLRQNVEFPLELRDGRKGRAARARASA